MRRWGVVRAGRGLLLGFLELFDVFVKIVFLQKTGDYLTDRFGRVNPQNTGFIPGGGFFGVGDNSLEGGGGNFNVHMN